MKKQGHPEYQDILFVDTATGARFVIGSTLKPKDREMFEGQEYPAYKVSISSASHPFFTGSQQLLDAEGRVDKFLKRYAGKKPVPVQDKEEKKEEKDQSKKKKK
jgi:large subunit ribosomal protein L31